MARIALLPVILTCFLGFALFHMKNYVQVLEDQLTKLQSDILTEKEAIHVLKAEWSYLNNPERLALLNEKYLKYDPLEVKAIVDLVNLPQKECPAATPEVPLPCEEQVMLINHVKPSR